jgi:polar amino acid transport system substrate-binding protein
MTSLDELREFAPSGRLRGAVAVAPVPTAFFATRDECGAPTGVTVELLRNFADTIGLPLDIHIFDNSGEVTDALAAGECDIAFMPRDAERAKRVDFGPPYYLIESTYLVPPGSAIENLDEVNRPGIRIVAISNTTTARSARRTAPNAMVEEVPSVERLMAMADAGEGDAFALSRDAFATMLQKLPGARVLAGNFQETGIAVAVPKGRPAALKIAVRLVENAKQSGALRRVLDNAGFTGAEVAPPAA